MTLTVAIIGRPNVGKSTLYNRLVGRRQALVHDTPGVTRDRREGKGRLAALSFRVIDTAGLEEGEDESLEGRMWRQTEAALEEADVALLLIDARAGVTPIDEHFAQRLRRRGDSVLTLANKCEGQAAEAGYYEAFALGLGEPIAISAEHGEGLTELHDALAALQDGAAGSESAGQAPDDDENQSALTLAVVGRPNVGKSTLINQLIGAQRLLTGPEAGITRDAIAVTWESAGRTIELVDTAGLRRKARVQEKLEQMSTADTVRAIRMAQVVVLVIDACQGLEKQDLTIADLTVREGRVLVLALNKWDLVADRAAARRALDERLEISLPQVRGLPVVALSALTGERLERLMPAVNAAYEVWNRRVPTGELNRWLAEAQQRHPPPAQRGRRLRLRYMTQVKARPPTFVLFTGRPQALPESYSRYLVNDLRQVFGFAGSPIRLNLRKGRNPYVSKG
ncbi:MAG TPA: ribosome biogenesis GTPase Der [Alphaproteobacteria bacterium]|jgi:GTP-binding protein|nr:ribosome biogenesis GTPase Der [Alphaproteobacteria bacterium]MDP7163910.1 ribosome biogenesis GTPase Der [Alphaproteobacteria bacterium]MDP7427624.1 ribosome biogenesis GTPase Der [Alphaproteobacteria bacterium]HJM50892.1 ribosome biogenesis GTPase Der [Alphaproteobacteria bacterium]